jgi:hypothetical protein
MLNGYWLNTRCCYISLDCGFLSLKIGVSDAIQRRPAKAEILHKLNSRAGVT